MRGHLSRPPDRSHDLHAFSFHAVKNLPTGDGGALTVRSPDLAARARRLRWSGISSDTFERASGGYRWDYAVTELGFKCPMNDIHAALPCPARTRRRRQRPRAEIAAQYRAGLDGVPGIELLRSEPDRTSSFHLFCALAERRDDLVDKLTERGIDVGVHYTAELPVSDVPHPAPSNVESFWRRAISLPMHVALTDEEVGEVIAGHS